MEEERLVSFTLTRHKLALVGERVLPLRDPKVASHRWGGATAISGTLASILRNAITRVQQIIGGKSL